MEHSGSEDQNSDLYKIRHSLAHIMAQAVQELYPGTKLGFGPPISDGFYYDFILPEPINEENFKDIEKKMKHIIKQNQKFEYEDLPKDEAIKKIEGMGEPYKAEYAQDLINKNGLDHLRFYTNGKFVDMCEGPHVENTNKIPAAAFKLRSLAGAYWRADSKNQMMTRIYAWAFETREELDDHVKAYKLAQERDHKKLGKELDIFVIDEEIGKGLPLWLPNGAVIRDELQKYMEELEFRAGYQRVHTPQLTKTSLYYKTGHLPYYAEGMYPTMQMKEDDDSEVMEEYVLRPMNCPHHHKVYSARPRSYRDLPLRLAEYGQVYRYEDSGAVSGLLRVRGMCMNDAHIYCTKEQAVDELVGVLEMHDEVYKTLGFKDYHVRLSTWDPEDPKGKEKFINDPEGWKFAESALVEALERHGIKYKIGIGEGAFYGPKMDFQFKTVTGREETISTNQLDFGIAKRLGLTYKGADGEDHTPYIVHRAPASTHERIVAFLIEHYGGAFPTWLAPVQVKFIPVAEAFFDYAHKLSKELRDSMIRSEVDDSSESLNKKIRTNTKKKIPYLLIVGENEMKENAVTIRRYGVKEQETVSFDSFREDLQTQISSRR